MKRVVKGFTLKFKSLRDFKRCVMFTSHDLNTLNWVNILVEKLRPETMDEFEKHRLHYLGTLSPLYLT